MMADFLKEVGTTEVARDSLNIEEKQTSKLISAGPQNTANNPIRSGWFPDVHSLYFPQNLVLRHGDDMIITALSAVS